MGIMKKTKTDEMRWAFYLLAGLLFLRVIGVRLPMLAVVVFLIAGIVFMRNNTKDSSGAFTFILGVGMWGVAYNIFTGDTSLYAAVPAGVVEKAMNSTPLTDFFLNIWNALLSVWAFFMSYMRGKVRYK